MHRIVFVPTFSGWQSEARRALAQEVPPEMVFWEEAAGDQSVLQFPEGQEKTTVTARHRVPRSFMALSESVACHRDGSRWDLLYRVLWRLTHGEPHLMEILVDNDVRRMSGMDKAVRRDIHKMRAFVRFRLVERDGHSWYVAWFEPDHHIVERNAPFFVKRFAGMNWSILTPDRCAHWDGSELLFTDGVSRATAPTEDEWESLWLTYYRNIFNPARIKIHAMTAEMPKKYWKNLPEAAAIPSLLEEAPARVKQMLELSARKVEFASVPIPEISSLSALETAARSCQACPLYLKATQVVFGRGPAAARLVFVGEQPGDQEDIAGEPFVGPAGKLLDRALKDAGIDREACYVTNAVRHFKWEPRGKHRIHKKPAAGEVAACRPWLEAELALIQPRVLVCLGGTAAQSVIGSAARVLRDRGKMVATPFCSRTMITIHPSALLRAPDEESRKTGYQLFVEELRTAAGWLND